MAEANGGFGGFRQVPMGFDKNQVNEYITDLRKKMLAMEADMKANEEKTEEAVKLAEEADNRIKEAVAVESAKVSDLTMQLNREKERGDNFTAKVNELKQQLADEKQKMTDMLKSGKGVSAEAQKAYSEIVDKANADAADIIAKAKAEAEKIAAEAEKCRAQAADKLEQFMDALRAQVETINDSYSAVSFAAGELLGSSMPAPAAMPDLAKPVLTKPVAPAPTEEVEEAEAPAFVADVADTEPEEDDGDVAETLEDLMSALEAVAPAAEVEAEDENDGTAESLEDLMSALEAVSAPAADEDNSDSMPSIDRSSRASSAPATFEDAWGGSELAQTIYNKEMNGGVPLVNPDAKDVFGQDLFGMGLDMSEESSDDMNSDIGGFDLNDVDEVKPLDTSDHSEVSFNKGFDNELLSQTMHSSSLGPDADEDLLNAVKAKEAAFEVKPNISMDEDEDEPDDAADLMKSIQDAEAALNNLAGGTLSGNIETTDDNSAASDPWADLQKQLDAMELSGGMTADEEVYQSSAQPAEPEAPSADDSSIWDLGGSSDDSSDDDMMSGDFGGFGF